MLSRILSKAVRLTNRPASSYGELTYKPELILQK